MKLLGLVGVTCFGLLVALLIANFYEAKREPPVEVVKVEKAKAVGHPVEKRRDPEEERRQKEEQQRAAKEKRRIADEQRAANEQLRAAEEEIRIIANRIRDGDPGLLDAKLIDADVEVRVKWITALSTLGPDARKSAGRLIEIMEKDKSPAVRIQAAKALGHIFFEKKIKPDEKNVVPALIKAMLSDGDSLVRRSACYSLGNIGPDAEEAAEALLDLFLDKDQLFLSDTARSSFWRVIGPKSKKLGLRLLGMYKKGIEEEQTERTVFFALGKSSAPKEEVLAIYMNALKDPRMRIYAVDALAFMGPDAKAAVPLLVEVLEQGLKSKNNADRFWLMTVRALGNIGLDARTAIPAIKKAQDEYPRDIDVIFEANRALLAIEARPKK